MKAREIYDEIFEVLNKYEEFCIFNVRYLREKADIHIFGFKLKDEYGLNINPKNIQSLNWNNVGNYRTIGLWGKNHQRTIGCSVDGTQPEDEYLLQIYFPTGAYIFTNHSSLDEYPQEYFQRFFSELKSYNPDYVDEVNHGLFWKLENAKDVFNSFNDILDKYHENYKNDWKKRKIERLENEIKKLKNE